MPNNTLTCELCGKAYPSASLILVDESLICEHCYSYRGTCATCAKNTDCLFESDPSPLPKVTVQTTRQGNMTIQQQVINPERVAITCAKGCSCYCDGECARQLNFCTSYTAVWCNNQSNYPQSQESDTKAT